jgi:hypothetical protein
MPKRKLSDEALAPGILEEDLPNPAAKKPRGV